MGQTVTISVTLPVSKAERLLSYVQELESDDPASLDTTVVSPQDEPIQAILEIKDHTKLAYLLDDQLRKLVSFAIEHNGTFYNKNLAEELGIDTPLTSIYLGHLTRKLSKTGVNALNWYTKQRTANGTLLIVREDVLEMFREAVKK